MLGASGTFGMAVNELASMDDKLTVVTADLCFFSGLERFKVQFPEQFFNVGIAEQNMIGVAAGMAKEGMNVFATTYATFATTRALDQVRVSMGYMGFPIKLIGLTSGFEVGNLGATHMSLEDIAIMRSIPNMVVLSPADCTETMKAIIDVASLNSPVYIRMSGMMRTPIVYNQDFNFEIGKMIRLAEGEDVTIFATGTMVKEAISAAKSLSEDGISCEVFDVHTIKPLDVETVHGSCKSKLIVTVEEHSIIGGLGSAIAETLAPIPNKPPQLIIGVNDYYPHAASYDYLTKQCGLKADKIKEKIVIKFMEDRNLD